MSRIILKTLFPLIALLLLNGCATKGDYNEFVSTINFSKFQTFSYKHALISGMEFRSSEEMMLKQLSQENLQEAFQELDFGLDPSGGDFFVVVKWRKAVSSYPSTFHSIDGPFDSLNDRQDNPSYRFASRYNLTVECYETETQKLFWRSELPNIFDANQLTTERVELSLQRAIKNFPRRVERDPDLPSIE